MRFLYIVVFLIVGILTMPINAGSFQRSDVSFSSMETVRGDVILINIKADGSGAPPRVTWMNNDISLVNNPSRGLWQGFLAADLNSKPGSYEALVRTTSPDVEERFDIRINDTDYGVRNLTLPKEKVELDAESLKRVKEETAIISALWHAPKAAPAWMGGFLMPVDGEVVGTFGKRSVINNMERSPHTGLDQKGDTGDPVRAINKGKVVLTADHFFTGNSIFVDHGGGIISMYFHLDSIMVREGETVEKGEIIGLVGATGRVTGPHLHWGMRVNGSRVNPLTFVQLSSGLEE